MITTGDTVFEDSWVSPADIRTPEKTQACSIESRSRDTLEARACPPLTLLWHSRALPLRTTFARIRRKIVVRQLNSDQATVAAGAGNSV